MWRVVTGMTNTYAAQARTGLSPEWDRGFDEAFTELVTGDPDLVRDEFDALISANWDEPPEPPAPPAEPPRSPSGPPPGMSGRTGTDAGADGPERSPP